MDAVTQGNFNRLIFETIAVALHKFCTLVGSCELVYIQVHCNHTGSDSATDQIDPATSCAEGLVQLGYIAVACGLEQTDLSHRHEHGLVMRKMMNMMTMAW